MAVEISVPSGDTEHDQRDDRPQHCEQDEQRQRVTVGKLHDISDASRFACPALLRHTDQCRVSSYPRQHANAHREAAAVMVLLSIAVRRPAPGGSRHPEPTECRDVVLAPRWVASGLW